MGAILDIAIFLLATTKYFQKESSWDSRIVPIISTWGSDIEHLYFVFGNYHYDRDFLKRNCEATEDEYYGTTTASNRHLMAGIKTVHYENSSVLYRCSDKLRYKSTSIPVDSNPNLNLSLNPNPNPNLINTNINDKSKSKYINALLHLNCTGEYFGFGPTCRCQESLRYMYYSPKFKDIKWFMFMDDDVFIRPIPLTSMLNQFTLNAKSGLEVALISSNMYRGFGFSKFWRKMNVDCKVDGVHSFSIAMPAIVNRKCLEIIAPAIDSNGMTSLQALWGGTHDAIFGLIFWLYQITTYSFTDSYFDRTSLTNNIIHVINKTSTIIVHRVKNMKIQPKNNNNPNNMKFIPSAFDLQLYFNDTVTNTNTKEAKEANTSLTDVGIRAYSSLIKQVDSGVLRTAFSQRAAEMRSLRSYYPFRFQDCALL